MQKRKTERGFDIIEFNDYYDHKCSLQKSSLASRDAIWLGISDAEPKILASQTPEGGTGWVPYPIPDNVSLTTRMHLSRREVLRLLPHLIKFLFTGRI